MKEVVKKINFNNKFKSKGELEISKFLEKEKISYEYEFPIAIVDDKKTKIWYPDFYLKEYQIVLEYFGMYEKDSEYRKIADRKKKIFKSCGIQFLPVYSLRDGWEEYIISKLLEYLEIKIKKIEKIDKKYHTKTVTKKSIFERFF